jgi:hypothetical protein
MMMAAFRVVLAGVIQMVVARVAIGEKMAF